MTLWRNYMEDIDTVVPIFSATCQEFCKFFTVVSYTGDVVQNNKTILFSSLIISLILSLKFSIKSMNSSNSFAKWNSTLLAKQDCISACLSSSVSIWLTYSVLTKLPKNLFSPNFWRKYVFPHPILPTTSTFPLNCPL